VLQAHYLEAGRLDAAEMGVQVSAGCVRHDEAEAVGIVEPFNDTVC
jgi:hypothetical protein